MAGEAEALKKINGEQKVVYEYKENVEIKYFGELALLNDEVRKASIRVTSDIMIVSLLSKQAFKRLLGNISVILNRNEGKYKKFMES